MKDLYDLKRNQSIPSISLIQNNKIKTFSDIEKIKTFNTSKTTQGMLKDWPVDIKKVIQDRNMDWQKLMKTPMNGNYMDEYFPHTSSTKDDWLWKIKTMT